MENSFFSIDRLIEFGMGIAVAQQMVRMMNETMQNMYVPGTMNPMQPSPNNIYYVIMDGQQSGPYTESELARLIGQKKVTKDTYIWKPGMTDWQTAERLPDVLRLVALTPVPFNK
ncbi:MAG: DUF4339 domain-containing protein [Bacteroidales bacterium]|nr:DUF4339 domain-containing protein [Bacteroidales bacterium]